MGIFYAEFFKDSIWNSDWEKRRIHLNKCILQTFSVYDLIFVQVLVGPAFIITWRGTWQNADEFMDNIIFKVQIF